MTVAASVSFKKIISWSLKSKKLKPPELIYVSGDQTAKPTCFM